MSVNSQPKTPATNTLSDWLKYGIDMLTKVDAPSPRLDSEVLLGHLVGVSRTYLHAHPEHELDTRQVEIYRSMLTLRQERVPVAYITGHKQFYGRSFLVNPNTLIPRPESETIIDILKTLPRFKTLIDVGCGSGCLGISAQCELPNIELTLADISTSALVITKKNTVKHAATAHIVRSDLLADIGPGSFDVIVANLPYVDKTWHTSVELKHEPRLALYAENRGLALISRLLEQVPHRLNKGGHLLLESDPVQHAAIISQAQKYGLTHVQTVEYITLFSQS